MDPYLQDFQGELDYLVQSLRWLAPSSGDLEGLAYEVFLALQPLMASDHGPSPLRVQMFGAAYRRCGRPAGLRGRELPGRPSRVDIGGRGRKPAELEDPFSVLQAALERIPLRCRAVLILHDIDGLPMGDVAETLTMSRLLVRWRLRRARRMFAQAVQHLSGFQPRRRPSGSAVVPEAAELLTAAQVIPREPEEVRSRFVARALADLDTRAEAAAGGVGGVRVRGFRLALAACLAFAVGEAVAALVFGGGN